MAYIKSFLFLLIVSVLAYTASPYVGYQALGSIFLLVILVVSAFSSVGPTLLIAFLAGFIWDFFFIPPKFAFRIQSHEDIMMLTSFFLTALLGSYLTFKIRRQENIEKLHQTLLNSVSHELRTPITTILGTATALRDPKTILDQHSRNFLIDELILSTRRLDSVVENLLDMSRLEKGSLQLKKEWFDAHDLISESLVDLAEELQQRQIKICDEKSILIEGDFKLLKHALINLLQNASRYSKPESPIEIDVESVAKGVRIAVKDYGQGLLPGEEQKIFKKFYRIPGTPVGGLGLGLSIVQNIIELHGGSVHAYNREKLKGAVFECLLPVRTPPKKLKEMLDESAR